MTPRRIRTLLAPVAALALLGACGGGPVGDWRQALGRPVGDPVAVRPARPLEIPPTAALPPPGGPNRAGEALVVRADRRAG